MASTRRTTSPARSGVAALPRPQRVDVARVLPSARSLLVGLALLAAAAGAYALARETSMFSVDRIVVRGTDARGRREVRRALADLRGTSLLATSPAAIERRLQALPDVASATYDRAFPHTLRVVVQPERPVAVLRRGAETWLVSARARVLRRVPRGTLRALPRVWAPQNTRVVLGDTVAERPGAEILALARLTRQPLPGGVQGATLDDRRGLVFLLRDGLQVRLGSSAQLALKLAVARRIVPIVPAGTTVLDVSVPQRPVSSNSQVGG